MRRAWITISSVVSALSLCGCTLITGPQPGEGSRDRETRRKTEPVIAALERFHRERGHYPAKIQELVPRYLADQRDLGIGSFNYSKQGSEYILMYDYVSGFALHRGVNQCVYYSKKKKWVCGGYT
jgi:hypothetical protein